MAVMAMTSADARAEARRSGMRARADAMAIEPAARADRPDMGAGMHAAITDASACADNMTRVAASFHAVTIHAAARADIADMGARADAMASDMGTDTDAQDFNMGADGIGRNGREQRKGAKRSGEKFHDSNPVERYGNEQWLPKFPARYFGVSLISLLVAGVLSPITPPPLSVST
jgi:hypothetical protein